MKFILIISVAIGAAACSKSHAETVSDQHLRSAEFSKCMENVDLRALHNTQWNACITAELQRSEARLQTAYTKLKESLSDPNRMAPDAGQNRAAELQKAQNSWRVFRDDYCTFAASSGEAPNPEYNRLDCLVDLTNEQAKRFEEAY